MDKARILLIDDDPAVSRSLGRVLQVLGGYVVQTELDGRRAMDAARAFRPDLILLDVVAPHWDGGEVAAEIEANPELRSIPLAFLTGLVSADEIEERVTDSRGRRLIPKSLEPADLVDVVRELLAGRILRAGPVATDHGRQALARLLVGFSAAAKQSLADGELDALVDRLWPDFKAAVAVAHAEMRENETAGYQRWKESRHGGKSEEREG